MKKNKKLFITNMTLLGILCILYLVYEGYINIAATSVGIALKYEEQEAIKLVQSLALYFGIRSLITIVIYIILSMLNYYFYNKKNKKVLLITTITLAILIIYFIANIIRLFY